MSQKWHPSKRNCHLRPQRGQLRTVGADVPRNRKLNLPMSPTRITASHRITKKRTKPSQNLRVKHLSLKRPCKQKRRREPCNYRPGTTIGNSWLRLMMQCSACLLLNSWDLQSRSRWTLRTTCRHTPRGEIDPRSKSCFSSQGRLRLPFTFPWWHRILWT